MHAIRQIYESAPDVIQVPESLRRRRVEIILLVHDDAEPVPDSLKAVLMAMPARGAALYIPATRRYGHGNTGR